MTSITGHSHAANALDLVNIPAATGPSSELHIARLAFENGAHSNWGPGRPWWRIDWPDAEYHFTSGVERYTVIDVAGDSVHVPLSDNNVFDYP